VFRAVARALAAAVPRSEPATAATGRRLVAASTGSGAPTAGVNFDLDVTPWLLRLGFSKTQAQRAAAHCEGLADAPLEERVRAALSFLRPPARVSGGLRASARA